MCYAFDYQHGKLTSIDYNGEEIAQYTMRVGSTGWYQNQMDAMTDVGSGIYAEIQLYQPPDLRGGRGGGRRSRRQGRNYQDR